MMNDEIKETNIKIPEQYELLDEIEKLQQELQRKDNIIKDAKEVLLTTNNIEKALNVLDKITELKGDNM